MERVSVPYWQISCTVIIFNAFPPKWHREEYRRFSASYRTREEAEAVAFDIAVRYPEVMGALYVEERRLEA